jgi:phage repressor protein C with HTH and peptisase S24 domain
MGSEDLKKSPAFRLRHVMKIYGFSSDYAMERATGLKRSTLRNILKRDRIGPKSARLIADALDISATWLESGFGPIRSTEIGPTTFSVDPERSPVTFSFVPKAQSKVSAGGGILPEEGTSEEHYAFREQWLRRVTRDVRRVILLDVDGDSMAPTLLHKDTVLVDLNRIALREGRIYAIAVGEVLQIKRLQLMAGERIKIISDNPSYHTYDVRADEIRIIGQMIWFCRTLI